MFFNEQVIYDDNSHFHRSYSNDVFLKYIDLAKKYRFGNY